MDLTAHIEIESTGVNKDVRPGSESSSTTYDYGNMTIYNQIQK
jgi:hypothetical protein